MKKYGQADLMCYLIHKHLSEDMDQLTDAEKSEIEMQCFAEISKKYPSARDLEVCA